MAHEKHLILEEKRQGLPFYFDFESKRKYVWKKNQDSE